MKLTTKRKLFGKMKPRIWDVYLDGLLIAIVSRQSKNWIGNVAIWGFVEGLEGKGVYRECREAMEKLAKIVEKAHLGKQDEWEIDV